MVDKIGNLLNSTQNAVLQSIKTSQRIVDKVQLALASGKDVASALDNPQNFFLSRSLSYQAQDLTQLLDGIKLNIQAIQGVDAGVTAISKILDQTDSLIKEAITKLYSGTTTSLETDFDTTEIASILAANPGVSFSAATKSFYKVVTAPTNWTAANAAAQSATLAQPADITGITGVTGHLANITSQAENDYVFLISGGNAWLGGTDQAVEGTWQWTSGPENGQQFWQGLAGGSTVNGSYANWGGGEPNNSSNEDYAQMRGDGQWNDLPNGNALNYVIEWNFTRTSDPDLVARAAQYSAQHAVLLDQIDKLARDTQYRGVQLLDNDDLTTVFNTDRTHFLVTQGTDATSQGLGLKASNFRSLSGLNAALEDVRSAKEFLRTYSTSVSVDLGIISSRLDFTQNTINIHKSAAEDLVAADQNEKGAELLALQVRQQLQFTSLSLASAPTINSIF